ncbi:alpha/beta fold hydrolase [Cohnella zeiphila]|uniref:Alpha/beta hydrolase n=1 Tax=Cohnella zeiphila TaxID=2761120 RepID=A0A7X0VX59_9BACL|nr:alpha/beta hydrolase [Cohnella zeiphila]MBB6733225.1 alpha/beta hydrolase [Cohnella zeiphila]
MKIAHSQDGTKIAYEVQGSGPPLILVDGALCSRTNGPNGALAALLRERFTVYTYDRRGRGDSGDTAPYAIEREVEDLAALIAEAGGSADVYGISSGAALVLEAAARLPSIRKIALYEAPFIVDGTRRPVAGDYLSRMESHLASGRRGAAVKQFMRQGVGVPAPFVAMMQLMPAWPKLKAVAHTLPYDTLLTIDSQQGRAFPAGRWSNVKIPALVATGGKSPAWMRNAMRALADAVPGAKFQTLEGQTHIVKPAALAPILTEFFAR